MPGPNEFNGSLSFFLGSTLAEYEEQKKKQTQELADHKQEVPALPQGLPAANQSVQDKKQEIPDQKYAPKDQEDWESRAKFIESGDKKRFDSYKALTTISETHRNDILSVYHCFMHHKDLMCIPSKPERDALIALGPETMSNSDSRAIRQILQDKIVLDNMKFIDDIEELKELAESCQKIGAGKEQEKCKKIFDQALKRMLLEFRAKSSYIQKKIDYAHWTNTHQGNETSLADIDNAFAEYCKIYPHLPSPKIPARYKKYDTVMNELVAAADALHGPYNKKLGIYFADKVRVKEHSAINDLKDDLKKTSDALLREVKDLSNKFSTVKEKLLNSKPGADKEQAVAVNGENKGDNNPKTNQEGQELLKEDTELKEALVKIKRRIKALNSAQLSLAQSEAECMSLRKTIDSLNKKLGFNNRPSQFIRNRNAVSSDACDLLKDLEIDLYNVNLEKQNLELDFNELLEYQRLQAEIKELETECDQLVDRINRAEKELKISTSVESIYKNIKQISADIKEFPKNITKLFANLRGQEKTPELVEKYQAEIRAYKKRKEDLEAEKAKLDVFRLTKNDLKAKTLNINQIDARLRHITQLNNEYWANLMRVQFEPAAAAVEDWNKPLEAFYKSQESNVAKVLEKPSFMSQLLKGSAYAASGAAIGGGLGFLTKLANPFSLLNPFSTIKTTLVGSALGAAIGTVIFAGWRSEPGNEAASLERFNQEMSEIGFNNKKYDELTENIAKLFTYRDCLISGKKAGKAKNLRSEFISFIRQQPECEGLVALDMDVAIEAYFIMQLGKLINNSFTQIFNNHDEHINKGNSVFRYLTKWTRNKEYNKDREVFTAKMQIEFLQGIGNYLQAKIDEPGFFAAHKLEMRTLASVCVIGAAAIGVFLGVGFGFGIPFALCIVAAVVGFGLPHVPYFALKRKPKDRENLEKVKQTVLAEKSRLEKSGAEVVEHGLEQQLHIERIQADAKLGTLNRIFNTITASTWENKIGLGTVDAWLREYSERYRHNIITAKDFKSVIRTIMQKAATLTEEMQTELAAGMIYPQTGMDMTDIKHFKGLDKFIKDSEKFLFGTDEQSTNLRLEFASFNMQEKVKEQILEIVSVIPSTNKNELPKKLVDFYKKLGGSEEELWAIRRLHSIESIRKAATGLNFDMSKSSQPIFAGSDTYRLMIGKLWGERKIASGLTVTVTAPPIVSLSSKTVDRYLANSFAFLLSLDAETIKEGMSLTQEYKHSEKYIVYRTLLMKQLAELVDHAHEKYNASLEESILAFAKNKLNLKDPKAVFREIQHQGYVTENEHFGKASSEAKHDFDEDIDRFKTFESGIVDAVRTGLIYDSKMSPKSLIRQEINNKHLEDKKLFGFNPHTPRELGVQLTNDYLILVNQAIHDTGVLLYKIMKDPILKDFNVPNCYIEAALRNMDELIGNIKTVKLDGVEIKAAEEKSEQPLRRALTKEEGELLDKAIEALSMQQFKLRLAQNIHQEKQTALPELRKPLKFETKKYGLYKEVPGKTREEVEQDLKKALVVDNTDTDTHTIHFDLSRLIGEESWKIKLRSLINPLLTEAERQKMLPKLSEPKTAEAAQLLLATAG